MVLVRGNRIVGFVQLENIVVYVTEKQSRLIGLSEIRMTLKWQCIIFKLFLSSPIYIYFAILDEISKCNN